MFHINTAVSRETVASLLSAVVDAGYTYGCGYWGRVYHSLSKKPDVPMDFSDCGVFDEEIWYVHWPMFKGGYLTYIEHGDDFEVDEAMSKGERYILDMETIQRGLDVMSTKYPKQFAEVVRNEIDGALGDLFLQCCFFGKEKYA